MNRIHPKKLATSPKNKEKHFVVTEMELDEDGNVVKCVIEAVMSKREQKMNWQDLKDPELWRQVWK
ncbi:TIGR02450 family Trp-rich protein [Vibrio parahaemolyticus]|uniref:TIGR02450 family Trp-rich protein n=1 Tax=Vibrio parahaemolyticus TaxID=670 RepID=UPI000450CB0A|nr:TIGR02450 family Trp-rich protein [Vibrio parahaemolyticus]EJG0873218.1 TIGR02450 family Trp-rich protein [Vibrio parahaemolyticus O3]EJG0901876.1 TIGR02450 family Trp-rich protein [Vibrio parahaemolyticus O3:K56]EJG1073818.1 TIGR02450 family Trp-rich protein [Vibrio parahaemolyticus O1:K56]EGR1971875.1 TIGR02450 family Trp-rich protein [Vibrio parahaemolyticus]EGR5851230.1 TIGR02450 family Trp-rich protein [Vibrio parahaemolyticus]